MSAKIIEKAKITREGLSAYVDFLLLLCLVSFRKMNLMRRRNAVIFLVAIIVGIADVIVTVHNHNPPVNTQIIAGRKSERDRKKSNIQGKV